MTTPDRLTPSKLLFLSTGMAGSFLVSLSAQFPSTNIADLQGGIFSTPDEASWILTAYTMASLVGIVTSGLLIKTLGIGRYLVISAVVFATTALACATAPELGMMIALRTMQGFSAGGFGPAAFVAVFMVAGGPRLPFSVTLLAFVLLFPGTIGPVISGFAEDSFGWRALFLVQAGIGAMLALAARRLGAASGSRLVGSQDRLGCGHPAVARARDIDAGSQPGHAALLVRERDDRLVQRGLHRRVAGFVFLARFSPIPIIAPRLLCTRKFGIPIGLNLVFRAGLVVTAYLVPQFLAVVQGYRPLEIAELMVWAVIPQLLALPLVWWLMHLLDARVVMALGLLLCAMGTALVVDGTAALRRRAVPPDAGRLRRSASCCSSPRPSSSARALSSPRTCRPPPSSSI